MKKKKICFVTGSRAEYGLLYPLMKKVMEDKNLDMKLVATASHLSPEFGMTCREIENDGFTIDKKAEILLSADTPSAIAKSAGLGFISFGDIFTELVPDIVLILGDRFEIFPVAAAALFHRIPVAHIYGGERSEGAVDDSIRHALTKMSHLHFTAAESHRQRVIQMGENPDHVFTVGSLGIENALNTKLMIKKEFEKFTGFKTEDKNILVTYHPTTLEKGKAETEFKNILSALEKLEDTNIIFTRQNADAEGRIISEMTDRFVSENPSRRQVFTSMGRKGYLSALKFCAVVAGNSSSALIEAPCFETASVNIGNRQKNRLRPVSVIDCVPESDAILKTLKKAFSPAFRKKIKNIENPYGDGKTSGRIIKVLKKVNPDSLIMKSFNDIDFKIS